MKFLLFLLVISLQPVFGQVDSLGLKGILFQKNIVWEKHISSNFEIYVEKNKYADLKNKPIIEDLENQRKNIIAFLGDSTFKDIANIIIFDSIEDLKKILGFRVQGFTNSKLGIVFFVYNDSIDMVSKHELMHYYSYKIWGKFSDNFLSEGIAVFYENKWNGHQIDTLTKHIKDSNRLYDISSLVKNFYALNPMIAYPQIGSFTGFLLKEYGKQKLRYIWANGIKNVKAIYGKSIKQLEIEWLTKLDNLEVNNIDYIQHIK